MLYKRWKVLDLVKLMWRSSEPNWPMSNAKKEQRPSADGRQRLFANHLMLQRTETFFVVNDKEKNRNMIPVDAY
jgi:hypothetical protein